MSNVRMRPSHNPKTRAVNTRLRLGVLSLATVLVLTDCSATGDGSDDQIGKNNSRTAASVSDESSNSAKFGTAAAVLPLGEPSPI